MLSLRNPDGSIRELRGPIVLEEAREYHLIGSSSVRVWLAERELERADDGWRLPIDHWVGNTMLRVREADVVQDIPVRVIPSAAKFDAQAWMAMLEALEAWIAGVSTGLAGGRAGSVGNSGVSLTLLTEALLALVPELARCVRAIADAPKLRARECLEERAIYRVQAASRAVLGWIGRHPSAALFLRPGDAGGEVTLQPPRVQVHRSEDDVDHRANRYIAWLIGRVLQRLRQCAEDWRRHAARDDEPAVWARLRAEECERQAANVARSLKASFLGTLKREPLSEEAVLVIGDDPVYARTHRLARLLLSPMFDASRSSGPCAPVRDSFTIYELWCFLSLQQGLVRALPGAAWSATGLERLIIAGGTGANARYEAKLSNGRILVVKFNPTFCSHWARGRNPMWSLSKERRPDMVISASGGGRAPRWLFLDAKYRVSRKALGDAFESVHIYRDGLRDDENGGACVAGALLAPRQVHDTAAWFSEEYLNRHRCGVFELAPQSGADAVVKWVLRWLDCDDPGGMP